MAKTRLQRPTTLLAGARSGGLLFGTGLSEVDNAAVTALAVTAVHG